MERIRNTMDEDREENVCELDDGTGSDDVDFCSKFPDEKAVIFGCV